jgi:hypothetical protein
MFVLVEAPDSLDTKGELSIDSAHAVYEHQGRVLTTCINMIRSLSILSCATAAAAQFNYPHTQYDTSPPVYPSRELVMPTIYVLTDSNRSKYHRSWWMGGGTRESPSLCWESDS